MASTKINFRPGDSDKVIFTPTQALCPRCCVVWPIERIGRADEKDPTLRLAAHPHRALVTTLLGEEVWTELAIKCKGSGKLVVHLMAAEILSAVRSRRAA